MDFQLRESNLATLEDMQNNVVDVEANLLIRRAKLKEEEKKNIVEHLAYSEVKLDILVSTIEEIMQRITMRDVFSVHNYHDPLIPENEEIASPKNFPANPSYHRSENGFVDQSEEKKSDNIMCMIGDITYIDDLPNFDQYDNNYVLQT